MKQVFYLLLILFLVTSCGTINPESPALSVQPAPPMPLSESSVYLPIKINLQPYLNEAEKSLPKTFYGKEDPCEGVAYAYKFVRDPIDFEGKGSYMYYEVDGKYLLQLNYCPECTSMFNSKGTCVVPRIYASCGVGEPMRRVKVAYTTKFKITPDYQFSTTTELRKFETTDPCEITVFNYDATAQLRKEVTKVLKDLEDDIDKQMGDIDLRSTVSDVWQMLSEPVSLDRYGYLSIHPKAVSLSELQFDKKMAYVDMNLVIQPMVTTAPPVFKHSDLPRLSEHKQSEGFDIDVDIFATYDSLSSIMNSSLSGKKVQLKKNEVIFRSFGITGASNQQLNLKVAFDGDRKGTLYLVGTPVFDSVEQRISFPDLNFDIETKNALLKSAKWLFSDKITDVLRQNAIFDLKPHLSDLRTTLQKEMNMELTDGVRLTGKISDLKIIGIYPGEKNLQLRVNSSGDMKLSM